MRWELRKTVRQVAKASLLDMKRLDGGCVGDVYAITLVDGRKVVAKVGEPGSGLAIEGFMLTYLAENSALPVPKVLFQSDELLLMSHIDNFGRVGDREQRHAAELLADLHNRRGPAHGFVRDTLIGGLGQRNTFCDSWIEFFRDHRLMFMAEEAFKAGRLPQDLLARIENFCGHLHAHLDEPAYPSLMHGDMWAGNILCSGGRVVGFVDPAIYYGDAEMELAFSTLFSTFGQPFFDRYQELRPIRPGFFDARRDIYNLYPLLVHVRLFGGSYVGSVNSTLRHFGF